MTTVSPKRPTRWLVRCAVAAGCLLALSGCVVYDGPYGHPHGAYYGGGGGYYARPGWR